MKLQNAWLQKTAFIIKGTIVIEDHWKKWRGNSRWLPQSTWWDESATHKQAKESWKSALKTTQNTKTFCFVNSLNGPWQDGLQQQRIVVTNEKFHKECSFLTERKDVPSFLCPVLETRIPDRFVMPSGTKSDRFMFVLQARSWPSGANKVRSEKVDTSETRNAILGPKVFNFVFWRIDCVRCVPNLD